MTIIYLAALAVGLMYACAGLNKLCEPIRRVQMKMTMRRLLPYPMFFYWFVSLSELVAGTGLVFAPLFGWHLIAGLCAAILLCISVVAFMLDGIRNVRETWEPSNPADWVSSILYSPEPLLATLAAVCALRYLSAGL